MNHIVTFRRCACGLVVLALFVLAGVVPARAQHGVEPSLIVLDIRKGASAFSEIELRTNSPEPERVSITITRAIPQLDGTFISEEFSDEYVHNPETEPTIELLTDSVQVVRKENPKKIPFKVTMPRKVVGDEHLYFIFFAAETSRPVNNANAMVKFVQRIGVSVVIRTAGRRPNPKAELLQIGHEIIDGKLYLTALVKSSGNRSVNVGGILKLYDKESGNLVTSEQLVTPDPLAPHVVQQETIFAGFERLFKVLVREAIAAGEYRLVLQMDTSPGRGSRIRQNTELTLEEDIGPEELSTQELLVMQEPAISAAIAAGEQKNISFTVVSRHYEELVIQLSCDSDQIKTGSLPVRIKPGEKKTLQMLASNQNGEDFTATLLLAIQGRNGGIEVPVSITTK